MTATEELRRMLDERGLSHPTHYLHASWCVGSKLYVAMDNLDGTLTVDNLTPEQAIAATLGVSERTCRMKPVYASNALECSECGSYVATWDAECDVCSINYCPNCGAKVVGE